MMKKMTHLARIVIGWTEFLLIAVLLSTKTVLAVKDSLVQGNTTPADAFLQEYAKDSSAALQKFFGSPKSLLDKRGMLTDIAMKDNNARKTIQEVFSRVLSYGLYPERKEVIDLLGDWCSNGVAQDNGFVKRGDAAQLWCDCLRSYGEPTYGKERCLEYLFRYIADPDLEFRSVVLVNIIGLLVDQTEYDRYMPRVLEQVKKDKEAIAQEAIDDKSLEKIYWRIDYVERIAYSKQNYEYSDKKQLITDVEYFHFRDLPFEEQQRLAMQERKFRFMLLSALWESHCTKENLQRYMEDFVRPEVATGGVTELPRTIREIGYRLIKDLKGSDSVETQKLNEWFLNYVDDNLSRGKESGYDYRVLANGLFEYVQRMKDCSDDEQAASLERLRPLLYRGLITAVKLVPVTENRKTLKGFFVFEHALLALEGFTGDYRNTLAELGPTFDAWVAGNAPPKDQLPVNIIARFRKKLESGLTGGSSGGQYTQFGRIGPLFAIVVAVDARFGGRFRCHADVFL